MWDLLPSAQLMPTFAHAPTWKKIMKKRMEAPKTMRKPEGKGIALRKG